MGAKSAPKPDPRLVTRQIRSMDVQDEALREMMVNNRQFAPLQREQMEFGLQTQRTAYAQSQEDREWALAKRRQLDAAQEPFLREARDFDEGARGEQLRGEAYGDINQAFSEARGGGARALTRSGVNPSSGRFQAMQSQVGIQEALAKAKAGSMVRAAAKAEGMALRGNAANMLSGFPAQASALTGMGAGYGVGGLNAVNSGLAGLNGGWGAAAGAAGSMGQNAASMYGVQQNAYQQGQNAKNEIFGTLAGAALGGLLRF